MGRLLKVVPAALVAVYPLIVLFGLQRFPLHYLGFFLIAIALLRLLLTRGDENQQGLNLVLSVVMILVVAYVMFSGNPDWFRFYPVIVNTTFLAVFAWSLVRGMPVIERMARLTEPDLPDHAVPYALMAALFAAEWLVRQRVRRRLDA